MEGFSNPSKGYKSSLKQARGSVMLEGTVKRILAAVIFVGLLTGCGTKKLMTGQNQVKDSFRMGDYETAERLTDKMKTDDVYKAKDRVLYALEMGTINYFQGDHDQSVASFTDAEEYMDQFFSKSASTGVKAFLTNDIQLNYNGEVYEDVYLNGFKSLSYLKMDQFESALVEARRIAQKLEEAENKYGGYAESLSSVDTTKAITWEAGTSNIHDSPMSHYLAGVLYAKSGEKDDARIEVDKLKGAIANHQALPDSRLEFVSDFEKINDPDSYNVMLTAFSGSGPDKVQNNLNTDINRDGKGIKIAIPKLVMEPSQVGYVEAVINDTMTTSLPLIEEMDKVARETFQIKKPIIVARATVRGIMKSAAQEVGSRAVEKKWGGLAGDAFDLVGGKIREASEQADLRGWQTMPGKMYTNLVKLPPGKHTVSFNYYAPTGQLLHSEEQTIAMTSTERLEPVGSIYNN